jgi:23S rRNA (guanine2445-N2)-methyltransferase / 23S rRNA (guanine2069-N7)-methyltransferase
VQRDHAALIVSLAELLSEDGMLVFSCNRRKFAFDLEALTEAGLVCEDVTARTIPKDFERKPGVHTCWTVRRSKG